MRQHSPPFTSPALFHRSIANTLSVLIPMIAIGLIPRLIHAPIGKAACCALFAAANRLLNHQHDARVRRLPALLLWACPWCRSELVWESVAETFGPAVPFWVWSLTPPPRHRRPPDPSVPPHLTHAVPQRPSARRATCDKKEIFHFLFLISSV